MVDMTPLMLLMLISIATGVAAGLLAWREHPEPGALPLMLMLGGGTLWSIMFVFELQATTFSGKVFWSNYQWVGVVIVPVAWLLFSLEYTGRDHYVTLPTVAGLMIIPVVTVILALTGEFHDLLYVETTLVRENGLRLLHRVGGPWYWVITSFTYIAGIVGAIPLLDLVRRAANPFRGQSAALLIGIFAPAAINAVFLFGLIPITGFDPTPVGFAISGVAYLGAVRRLRLFGTSPAPTQGAHRLVFERMQEGALVVDDHGYVVDMNNNVADILDVEPSDVLGTHATDVVPSYETFPNHGQLEETYTIETAGVRRYFDVNVTQIYDYHDRTVGRVVTFHDIGQHLRQQQRLEVLNRVLRHNIRNETNLIYGYVNRLIESGNGEAERIKEVASRIEGLSDQARTISQLFDRADDDTETATLESLLETNLESVQSRFPEVEFECGSVPGSVHVSTVLSAVLRNLLENAAQHNTAASPRVSVSVEVREDEVSIVVADNGPGIEEYEREVLERGRESPLEHGSGLGLWLVKWGVHIAGGEISFETNEASGSVITVTVPIRSQSSEANTLKA